MKDADRRRKDRVDRRTAVYFESEGRKAKGVILNFSEVGMYIQTESLTPPGSMIVIPVLVEKNRYYKLQGRVVWVQKPTKSMLKASQPGGLGVQLEAAPAEYILLVQKMRKYLTTSAPRGVEERFEVYHKVNFQSGEEFLSEYTENLSRGGMYISTQRPLPKGTKIHAELNLPGLDAPIPVSGMVAYSLDEASAEERGRRPGMGIQFSDLPENVKSTLNHYIQRLEVHRSNPERRLTKDIPSKDSLSKYLVPEILLNLLKRKASGILHLTKDTSHKRVYIKNGHPIFVESTLRSESLGQYLVHHGKLTLETLDRWLPEIEKGDTRLANALMKQNIFDRGTVKKLLTEYHEEKIVHTFPWFTGQYEFEATQEFPSNVFIVPIQVYRVIFEGVERWFDPVLINSWMGLNEDSILLRKSLPDASIPLPPLAYRILHELWGEQPIRKVCENLDKTLANVLPTAYALIVSGFASLKHQSIRESTSPSEDPQEPEHTPAPLASSQAKIDEARILEWATFIEKEHMRLRDQDFFRILGIPLDAKSADITKAFLQRSQEYSKYDVDLIGDEQILLKLAEILSWLRTAYDTLRDPRLHAIYEQQTKPANEQITAPVRKDEIERALVEALFEFDRFRPSRALEKLEPLLKAHPEDHTLGAYYGWANFMMDEQKNVQKAIEFIDRGIASDPSDAQLQYFRGEIHAYLSHWRDAEKCFSQAIRLRPHFTRASISLESAKKNRIEAEKLQSLAK